MAAWEFVGIPQYDVMKEQKVMYEIKGDVRNPIPLPIPHRTFDHDRNFDPSAEAERQAFDVPDSAGLLPQQHPCPLLPPAGSVGPSFSVAVAKII
jgi:hypothetical protein